MPKTCPLSTQPEFQKVHAPQMQADIERALNESERKQKKVPKKKPPARGVNTSKPVVDKDGNTVLTHYSNTAGIETLSPSYMGKMGSVGKTLGLRGNNFRQGKPAIPYTSFGLNVGHLKGYKKEKGLGSVEYTAKISADRVYDLKTDPDNLRVRMDELIKQRNIPPMDKKSNNDVVSEVIKEAGYAGFFMTNDAGYGMTAAIWEDTAVQEVSNSKPIDARTNASERIVGLSEQYKQSAGITKPAPRVFKPVNKQFGKRVAMAYEAMKHTPHKPGVAAAYSALIEETLAQYKIILDSGFQAEFIPTGQSSPYAQPNQAVKDIVENNHMWVYSTREGHGAGENLADNPMLQPTQYVISGQTALANDIFRVVHDFFGHAKNGLGFRADGEEGAFISHSSMYSDLAVKALASETRGQNSWVNFGPYAKENKTASEEDTVFAPQKVGILPTALWKPTGS